jgi:hypothetical protein
MTAASGAGFCGLIAFSVPALHASVVFALNRQRSFTTHFGHSGVRALHG